MSPLKSVIFESEGQFDLVPCKGKDLCRECAFYNTRPCPADLCTSKNIFVRHDEKGKK